jgi:nucleoside-triphosphatase
MHIFLTGKPRGFMIRTTGGKEAVLAEKGLKSGRRLGKYGLDLRNLEETGVPALEHALRNSDIIVIDEIGKMELFSGRFRETVMKALDSPKKVVGVIHQSKQPFLDAIRARSDVLLLEVTGANNEEVWRKLKFHLGI